MPRKHPRHPGHAEAVRRDISNLAARLMAEDGISSYGLAKRKAAKQLGIPESEALPANQEIEEALRAYLALYQDEELPERLGTLRREALKVMRLLEEFSPYLTGPVLDGTAVRFAEAEIELFADSAKDVEIFLLNNGISFENVDNRRNTAHHMNDQLETRLRLAVDDSTLLISVYPHTLERTRRRNPHTGQVAGRAGIAAVAALLEQP